MMHEALQQLLSQIEVMKPELTQLLVDHTSIVVVGSVELALMFVQLVRYSRD
jgi:hypothetical protein